VVLVIFVDKSLKILGSCSSVDEDSGLLGIKLCWLASS